MSTDKTTTIKSHGLIFQLIFIKFIHRFFGGANISQFDGDLFVLHTGSLVSERYLLTVD